MSSQTSLTMKVGWWKLQLTLMAKPPLVLISMQNKGCPEPGAQPCSGAGCRSLSFGRAAPAGVCQAGLSPTAAGRSSASWQTAQPAKGSLPRAPPHFHGFLSQGWEPGRRRSCFTCAQLLWRQSRTVFSSPAILKGILQVLSPHLHQVRVSPWLSELSFGSKHGIDTAGCRRHLL